MIVWSVIRLGDNNSADHDDEISRDEQVEDDHDHHYHYLHEVLRLGCHLGDVLPLHAGVTHRLLCLQVTCLSAASGQHLLPGVDHGGEYDCGHGGQYEGDHGGEYYGDQGGEYDCDQRW